MLGYGDELAFSDKEIVCLGELLMSSDNYEHYDASEQVYIKTYQYGYEIFKRYNEILTAEEKFVFLKTVEKVEKVLGKKILKQN